MIKTVLLPLALIVIMFGMGLSLTLEDFKRVFISPKAKITGLILQVVSLPLIALGLISLFKLQGELAVGLMVIAACPGGATSNIFSHLSKGDTALSVSLTATSSVITIFTIPLIVEFSLQHFLGSGSGVHLPFGKTVIQLIIVTLLPITLGMFLHTKKPQLCLKLDKPVKAFSFFFLALIVIIAVTQEQDLLHQFILAGPAAISLNLLTMTLGFGVAWTIGLSIPQRVTIAIESGIQNGTLALAISLGILENPRIAVPAVVYSLLMFGTGSMMILIFGRKAPRSV